MSPPKAGAFKERPTGGTAFKKFYDRGDFPIALEHDTKGNKIAWKVSIQHLYSNVYHNACFRLTLIMSNTHDYM